MRCRQESRENFPEEDDRRAISDHIIFPSRQSAANLHDMPQSAGIVPWQLITTRWRTWDKRGTNDEQRTGKAHDGRGLNGLDHDELDQLEFEKKSGNEMTCLDGWMDGWMDAWTHPSRHSRMLSAPNPLDDAQRSMK